MSFCQWSKWCLAGESRYESSSTDSIPDRKSTIVDYSKHSRYHCLVHYFIFHRWFRLIELRLLCVCSYLAEGVSFIIRRSWCRNCLVFFVCSENLTRFFFSIQFQWRLMQLSSIFLVLLFIPKRTAILPKSSKLKFQWPWWFSIVGRLLRTKLTHIILTSNNGFCLMRWRSQVQNDHIAIQNSPTHYLWIFWELNH